MARVAKRSPLLHPVLLMFCFAWAIIATRTLLPTFNDFLADITVFVAQFFLMIVCFFYLYCIAELFWNEKYVESTFYFSIVCLLLLYFTDTALVFFTGLQIVAPLEDVRRIFAIGLIPANWIASMVLLGRLDAIRSRHLTRTTK